MALRPNDPDGSSEDPADRKKASQDEVFLREVDDALREDELKNFFARYGIPLIAVVVLGLAGLGGYLWWDHRQNEAAGERSEQFIVALDDLEANRIEDADRKLAAIAQDDAGASSVAAKLLRAGIALHQDKTDEAVRIYGEVAADSDAPQPYRDLATVREVGARFDDMKPQEVIDRLKPLAVPGNPWFGVAGELVGMAYLKQDREDLAGPLFAKIARDEELPQSLRGRARQLAGLLGFDAIEDVVGEKADAEPGEDGEDAAETAG